MLALCLVSVPGACEALRDFTVILSFLSISTVMTCYGAALALPTVGMSITLGAIKGAVTMKMMSSTSITSIKGTMLMSLMVRRRMLRGMDEDMGPVSL